MTQIGAGTKKMFVGREKELKVLSKRYQKTGMECIVIYGRRRVGKTALINTFIKDKTAIYFPALNTNAQGNLAALSKAVHAYLHPGAESAPVYASFDDAFSEITRIARSSERVIFVIDEFPYLAKADDSVSSRLQHLLDHDWANTGLFLILCGSSMSFMEKEVLSEKSPLFGRRTAQIKLEPLSYLETAGFHPELSLQDNALIYGITGGVPHYINKLDVTGTVKNALLENVFDTSSYLFEEPENLLKQELREPAVYNAVITVIANGATRLNEIADKAALDRGICSKYISVLKELGIVQKIEPVIDKSPRKSVYRIADHFFRFWYRFVPGNMMAISSGTMDRIFDSAVGSYLSDYMGKVFEDICRQYLISHPGKLPFPVSAIGEWWGAHPLRKKEIQLDIVACGAKGNNDRSGRQFIIGSCKYKNEEIGTDELNLIRDYASAFTTGDDTCAYYIFSKSGFTKGLKELEAEGQVTLIGLPELYEE